VKVLVLILAVILNVLGRLLPNVDVPVLIMAVMVDGMLALVVVVKVPTLVLDGGLNVPVFVLVDVDELEIVPVVPDMVLVVVVDVLVLIPVVVVFKLVVVVDRTVFMFGSVDKLVLTLKGFGVAEAVLVLFVVAV
jgi:hypothetical protein